MAFTGNYVTIDFIKESAKDILDFENVLSKYKIAELIWNVIRKLGDPNILINRITNGVDGPQPIDVVNFRGLLPLDLVEIINHTVRNYETKIKLIPTKNPFFLSDKEDSTLQVPVVDPDTGEAVFIDDSDTITTERYVSPIQVGTSTYGVADKYMIQDGEIITTLQEGQLELSYRAFPLDINGFPKIPDEEKVIELIKWSILERASIKLWAQGKIPERLYNHIESKYLYYKKAASNQLKINSIPEMEAFKNRHMRFNPDLNAYGNDFIDSGYPEQFNKHSW